MQYQDLLSHITPEIYERFKLAIELGKWPDGRVLTQAQKQSCMEAVLHYQQLHLPAHEHAGFMEQTCRSQTANINEVPLKVIL